MRRACAGAGTRGVARRLIQVADHTRRSSAAHALLVLEQRRTLSGEEQQAGLRFLRDLWAQVDDDMAVLVFTDLSRLAAHQLSMYDAAYLELAARRALVLSCKDGPLRTAAGRAGVPLWA